MKKFAVISVLVGGILIIVGAYLVSGILLKGSEKDISQENILKNNLAPNNLNSPQQASSPIKYSAKNNPQMLSFRSQNSKDEDDEVVDTKELAIFVGEDTARVLAQKGPYEAKHVRTIAHSLNNIEKELDRLRRENVPPEDLQAILRPYYQLQNQYYAVLNELEPYEPNRESARQLTDFKDALKREGNHLSEEERKALKRKILLTPNIKEAGSAH